ncbi:MAG: molybdate ABC transporter substrate-binding protein [Luteolibacter sp.]
MTYPAALVTASKDKISAQAFLDFLTTPQAQEILKSHGFLPPQAQP